MSGIVDMLGNAGGPAEKRSVCSGIILAQVTNIKDPQNLGRVKCAYITSGDEARETGWIHCITPFGGSGYGSFFHPNTGDIVALAYENGDIHRPFVIGSLWVKDVDPPVTVEDGKNEEYSLTTPNKSYVSFTDTKDKEKLTVSTPKKRTVTLDDENQIIQISDENNTLSLNGKSGEVELACDKKLTIKVGSGVTVTCDGTSGAVEIKANKELKLSAPQINLSASGTAEISGSGSVTVKSSGAMTIKGSITKIN